MMPALIVVALSLLTNLTAAQKVTDTPSVVNSRANCSATAQAFLQQVRCRQNASLSDGALNASVVALQQACSPQDLGQLRPVLTMNIETDYSTPALTAAVQQYNSTRAAGDWAVSVLTKPSEAVLATDEWDVAVLDLMSLGNFEESCVPITGELLAKVHRNQVDDHSLVTDSVPRTQAIIYGTTRLGVVIGTSAPQIIFRHDILKRAGVSPNALSTWGGVLQVALNLTGRDWDGDGQTEWGFCFNRMLDSTVGAIFTFSAPVVQTSGSNQGIWIDADKGTLLINNPGSYISQLILQRLGSIAPPSDMLARLEVPNQAFLRGRCIMSMSATARDFKAYSSSRQSRVRGKFSVLPTPGSDIVLDRTTDTLVPCNDTTCPFANLERPSKVLYDPTSPYKLDVKYTQLLRLNETTRQMLNIAPGQDLLSGPKINRVLLYTGVYLAVINKRLTAEGQRQAMKLLDYMSAYNTSWNLILNPDTDITAYRYAHFREINNFTPAASRWLAAGYDPVALPSYLDSISRDSDWGSNAAAELQIPNVNSMLGATLPDVDQLNYGLSPVVLSTRVTNMMLDLANYFFGSYQAFIQAYKTSLSYQDVPRQNFSPPPPPQPYAPPPPSHDNSQQVLQGAFTGVLVPSFAALVGAFFFVLMRNKRKHRGLFGRVVAPGAAHDTTFLVASVQDFDYLEDVLPSELLVRVSEIWDTVTKQLLEKHAGYMMPTTGPGCLRAAFHTPADAAWFAQSLHTELLSAKWPKQLLQEPEFQAVYIDDLHVDETPDNETQLQPQDDRKPSRRHPAGAATAALRQSALSASVSWGHTSASPAAAAISGPSFFQRTERVASENKNSPVVLPVLQTFRDQCAASWRVVQPGIALQMQATEAELPTGADATVKTAEDGNFAGKDSKPGWEEATGTPGVLVSRGLQVCISLCAVVSSKVEVVRDPVTRRTGYQGQAVDIAESIAVSGQGGMTLVPQQTFRQLPVEVMSEQLLFCHWGEYQFNSSLMALDVYLALSKRLMSRLARYGPLRVKHDGLALSHGVLSAPVEYAAMAFTHIVGIQTLLAWNFSLATQATEVFNRLAQKQLRQHDGYLVEHVSGFLLTAFQSPAAAILWALRVKDLMMCEPWCDDLLSHELCEEVLLSHNACEESHSACGERATGSRLTSSSLYISTGLCPRSELASPMRASSHEGIRAVQPEDCEHHSVASDARVERALVVHRGPRLKTGIDVGPILAALNTVTGRMAYRGKVMNRAARIAAYASSGQVLCSGEAMQASGGAEGINALKASYHAAHHSQTTSVTGARSSVDYSQRGSSVQGIRATQRHPTQADCTMLGGPGLPGYCPDMPRASPFLSPSYLMQGLRTKQTVTTDSLGMVPLKGVAEQVEIYRCQM